MRVCVKGIWPEWFGKYVLISLSETFAASYEHVFCVFYRKEFACLRACECSVREEHHC